MLKLIIKDYRKNQPSGGFVKRLAYAIAILVLLLISVSVYAQEESAKKVYNEDSQQAFGVQFGNVSGSGFGYRYFTETFGFQAVLGGYSTGADTYSFRDKIDADLTVNRITRTDKGRKYNMNLGLNTIYPLKKTDLFTFYLTGGLCWKYFNNKYYKQDYIPTQGDTLYFYPDSEGVYSSREVDSYVNVGFGPGVEIKAGRFFKLSIELPITYTGKHEFIMYVPSVGLYYYFK